MPGGIARREIARAVERDGEVGEIAAHAVSALQYSPDGKIGLARQVAKLDVIRQPPAGRLDAKPAVLNAVEFVPREPGESVRVAIAAEPRVAQQLRRQFARSPRHRARKVVVVRLRRGGDNRIVPEEVQAGSEHDPPDPFTVTVMKWSGRQAVAQRQGLEDERMVAAGPRLHV
jgi:hypothetical protein